MKLLRLILFFILLFSFAAKAQETAYFVETKSYQRAFGLTVENDMFFQTDHYYSAGESIHFIHPAISKSPFNRLLISMFNLGDVVYNGLKIDHKIFTPTDTPNAGLKIGDRPYASSLSISQFKVVENSEYAYRISSRFSLGIIGEYARGRELQSKIHEITPSEVPLGWEYQVKNDLLLNYYIKLDKGIYSSEYFEWLASASVNLGTVNNDIAFSTNARVGLIDSYFESYSPGKNSGFRTWMELSYKVKTIAYNAYLEGGLINRNSPYIIENGDMNRMSQKIGVHFFIQYNKHRIVFEGYRISPEFVGALWHQWGGISYQYWF
ncbi:MAG: lipid A deacylase LpxR family protein [Bacteroidota bacterium]